MSMYQMNQEVQSEGMSTKLFELGISDDNEMTNVLL